MKKLIVLLSVFTISISSFASPSQEKVAASASESLQVLDYVVGIQQTYSATSELTAKVVELLGGDGVNPTRMVLVLNTGMMEKAKVYELNTMMYKANRITFIAKDQIVINYVQDSFEGENLNQVQLKKSLKITVQRDSKGQLTDEILMEELKK